MKHTGGTKPSTSTNSVTQTGLNPMHVAAYYGQMDFVRAILREVSATVRSEPPTNFNPLITKELSQEVRTGSIDLHTVAPSLDTIFSFQYGLTPLHMAAQSGHEGLVRMLLNQTGVQVDASTATMVSPGTFHHQKSQRPAFRVSSHCTWRRSRVI